MSDSLKYGLKAGGMKDFRVTVCLVIFNLHSNFLVQKEQNPRWQEMGKGIVLLSVCECYFPYSALYITNWEDYAKG